MGHVFNGFFFGPYELYNHTVEMECGPFLAVLLFGEHREMLGKRLLRQINVFNRSEIDVWHMRHVTFFATGCACLYMNMSHCRPKKVLLQHEILNRNMRSSGTDHGMKGTVCTCPDVVIVVGGLMSMSGNSFIK